MTAPGSLVIDPVGPVVPAGATTDRRGSWVPGWRMIASRWRELVKRRGLMALLIGVIVGIPVIYLGIRLVLHAAAPHTYGVAGGYDSFVGLVAGVLFVFGFIVAATLGATAGSDDVADGMFRHHVITGRSRLALYFARIPAGLGIIVPLVAVGFTVVCAVSVFAAPPTLHYEGASLPAQLSRAGLAQWARAHPEEVVNNFPLDITPDDLVNSACLPGPGGPGGPGGAVGSPRNFKVVPVGTGPCTTAQLRTLAVHVAASDYADYSRQFRSPPVGLMIKTGLWIELEASVAFLVGLGLAALLGQRTVAVVMMIVLEVILTPIALRTHIPHMVNLQRGILGAATTHLEPGHLPVPFGGGSQSDQLQSVHESSLVAVLVVIGWIGVWTALGAWRMARRDT